jgi:hypothetical protein
MPLDLEIICGHLGGHKYKVAKERMSADFSKFGDAVIDHPSQPGKLLCPLTGKVLNRIEAEVRLYLSGKNYQKDYKAKHGKENPLFGKPLKLNGIASPKGKKTYFVDSPDKAVLSERNEVC